MSAVAPIADKLRLGLIVRQVPKVEGSLCWGLRVGISSLR